MIVKTAYIISYLPDVQILRSKRLEIAHRQLNWLLDNTDFDIIIYDQNYEDSDYLINPRITYLKGSKKAPQYARNELKKIFYQTDEYFGLFLDDDSILYDKERHMDGSHWMRSINLLDLDALKDIDIIVPLNPQRTAFTRQYEQNAGIYRKWFVFKHYIDLKTSLYFFKNPKYLGIKPLYNTSDIHLYHDMSFGFKCIQAGYRMYQLQNILLNEIAAGRSTLVETDNRGDQGRIDKAQLIEEWKGHGVHVDHYGKLDKSDFRKWYAKYPKEIRIEKI